MKSQDYSNTKKRNKSYINSTRTPRIKNNNNNKENVSKFTKDSL